MAKRISDEERRRQAEWLAQREPPYLTFERVEKRLEERRARANRSLLRRLFGGRRAA